MPPLWSEGLRLALTTFTVAPIAGPQRVDRPVGVWSMRFAPLMGGLLGLTLAGQLLLTRWLHAPSLLSAVLAVALAAVLTRGLHLDGLADTVDGLGSYRGRERALEIMRSPEVGPFGVAALVLMLLVQVAALTSIVARPWWAVVAAVVAAWAASRTAIMLGCRRGVPPARPDGLGSLVAGTVGLPMLASWTVATMVLAVWAVPDRPWQGPIAVAGALAVALLLRRHVVRRLGGITGDVLGLLAEASTATALVALSLA